MEQVYRSLNKALQALDEDRLGAYSVAAEACVYFDEVEAEIDRRCFIGLFIPKEHEQEVINDYNTSEISVLWDDFPMLMEETGFDLHLAEELQGMHDRFFYESDYEEAKSRFRTCLVTLIEEGRVTYSDSEGNPQTVDLAKKKYRGV